jgi:hypothetical protein
VVTMPAAQRAEEEPLHQPSGDDAGRAAGGGGAAPSTERL